MALPTPDDAPVTMATLLAKRVPEAGLLDVVRNLACFRKVNELDTTDTLDSIVLDAMYDACEATTEAIEGRATGSAAESERRKFEASIT